jgi:hypothetical protein
MSKYHSVAGWGIVLVSALATPALGQTQLGAQACAMVQEACTGPASGLPACQRMLALCNQQGNPANQSYNNTDENDDDDDDSGTPFPPQTPRIGLQGQTAMPAAANQWAAIDPELTQAIFQRYAAVTKLCQSDHKGACTWLNYARRPEGEAELLVGNLQRTCIRTNHGWDLPSPQPIMGTDYGQWTCNANKQNRDDAIASASDIIENGPNSRYFSAAVNTNNDADRDAQRRAAQHEHDQRMEQSKRAREQADRTYRAMHDLPPRGNAVR